MEWSIIDVAEDPQDPCACVSVSTGCRFDALDFGQARKRENTRAYLAGLPFDVVGELFKPNLVRPWGSM
jgi:hypothetical protein